MVDNNIHQKCSEASPVFSGTFRKMLSLQHVLFVIVIASSLGAPGNNVCKNFNDYLNANTNKNCWYNADTDLETPDLIKKYIGNVETHEAITEDGYILTIYRMPRKNPKGVILLQHPMNTNSRVYVLAGNQSTAYLLWKEGYDIWLGNQRGTKYSQKHIRLTPNDLKYWDWSLDETGYYDTPAIVNLVRSKTNSKIIYIGHSMGTTNGLIYASLRPEEAESSIERFVFASVSAYYKYGTAPVLQFASLEPILNTMGKMLGMRQATPNLPILKIILRRFFRFIPIMPMVYNYINTALIGGSVAEADPEMLNFDVINLMDDVSWKLMVQYLQLFVAKDRFQMYDYGPAENQRRYGMKMPPEFPLKNIRVPIHMIASQSDDFTTVKDAELLYERLPEEAKTQNGFGLKISTLNHNDIQLGKHRAEIFVGLLMNYLNEIRR